MADQPLQFPEGGQLFHFPAVIEGDNPAVNALQAQIDAAGGMAHMLDPAALAQFLGEDGEDDLNPALEAAYSQLMAAVRAGDTDGFHAVLATLSDEEVDTLTHQNWETPFRAACAAGALGIVQWLTSPDRRVPVDHDAGCDANQFDDETTPDMAMVDMGVYRASKAGHLEVVQHLLQVRPGTYHAAQCATEACTSPAGLPVLRYMLSLVNEDGTPAVPTNNNTYTEGYFINNITRTGDLELVQEFLARPDLEKPLPNSCLSSACCAGELSVVKLLMAQGEDAPDPNNHAALWPCSPPITACCMGDAVDIFDYLRSLPAGKRPVLGEEEKAPALLAACNGDTLSHPMAPNAPEVRRGASMGMLQRLLALEGAEAVQTWAMDGQAAQAAATGGQDAVLRILLPGFPSHLRLVVQRVALGSLMLGKGSVDALSASLEVFPGDTWQSDPAHVLALTPGLQTAGAGLWEAATFPRPLMDALRQWGVYARPFALPDPRTAGFLVWEDLTHPPRMPCGVSVMRMRPPGEQPRVQVEQLTPRPEGAPGLHNMPKPLQSQVVLDPDAAQASVQEVFGVVAGALARMNFARRRVFVLARQKGRDGTPSEAKRRRQG